MSRRGSRTSRRSICSIPRPRALPQKSRPSAGRRASPRARSTAFRSPSRTTSPPRASRCRWVLPASSRYRRRRMRRPPRGCAKSGAIIFAKTTMPDYGMLSSGLSSFHPLTRNPWDLSKNAGGSSSGAGAAGCGRLRPAASGHRYRRLGAAAGLMVRPGGAEAEFWAHSLRSTLCRPRRRTDDPHRRRRGADDVRAVEAGPPRRHQPAGRQQPALEGHRQAAAQAAPRPDARCRRGAEAGKRGAQRCRQGGQGIRIRRRRRSPRSTAS